MTDNKKISKDELKKIGHAIEHYKKVNGNYKKCMKFAYESVLSKQDIQSLESEDISTFEINSLKPYINPQIKQLCDSSPNLKFTSDKDEHSATLLNAYFDKVKSQSQYDTQLFKSIKSSIIGGFGVIKIKTDFCDEESFNQELSIVSHVNPTCVYFDPNANNAAKTDAKWVFELKKLAKSEFQDEYGEDKYNAIIKSIKETRESRVKWIENQKSEKETLTICEYYYYKSKAKYLSLDRDLMSDTGYTTNIYLKKSDIPDSSVKSRKIYDKKVMKKVFCCDVMLENPIESNFKILPYAFICGDSYVDDSGSEQPSSFIECAIDPLRMKTISLNMFFNNLSNRIDGTFIYDINSTPDDVVEDLANRGIKKRAYGYIGDYVDKNGIQQRGNPPQYISPPPISSEELQMMSVLDNQIEKILGTMSSNPDVEHSGAYLTKLSDYISASAEPFLQSFIEALQWIGKVILTTLPALHVSDYSFKDAEGQTYTIPSNFDPTICDVSVNRSLSTKLLKQESLNQLSKFATPESAIGAFLASPQGSKYILQQLDLVDREQMESDFSQFIQQQQQQAQMQSQQPNPQMIEAQARMTEAQAKEMKAQADMQSAQAKHGQNMIDAQLGNAKMQAELRKIVADEIFNVLEFTHKQNALEAENLKTILGG